VSRREAWLSAAAVFVVALGVRIAAAAVISFPVPEDTAYYAGVARNLAEGRGLISDALWSYQTQPLVVPRAAFELWLPLPSLLAAVPVALAGVANWFRASQVVAVLAGAVVAVLAWRLGADVAAEMRLPAGRARTMGVGSGLVAAVLGPLVLYGALPDSTALFAALSLAACLLMTRIAAAEDARIAGGDARTAAGGTGVAAAQDAPIHGGPPRDGGRSEMTGRRGFDRRLLGLGLLVGLAGLTRSEAIWLAFAWAVMAWFWTPGSRRRRIALAGVPIVVAGLVFAPWALRDWLVFGTPLPGQAIANALYVHDYDIFAYAAQPNLGTYLAQGPAALAGAHLAGFAHDLFGVLVIPAFPVSLLGLLALPWVGRRSALRPLVIAAVSTFLVTSLVFPVATLSGTYLHAAGSAFVLLSVAAVVALDKLVAAVGRVRHWTRPVAWLGPAFAIAAITPLCFVAVNTIANQADDVRSRYEALPAAMARAGVPLDGSRPVITDNPIWLAETARIPTLALPEESPETVVQLADRFGSRLLIVSADSGREWPAILDGGGTDAKCFQEVHLTDNSGMSLAKGSVLGQFHVFLIVCA
jgi:hypothetical protein